LLSQKQCGESDPEKSLPVFGSEESPSSHPFHGCTPLRAENSLPTGEEKHRIGEAEMLLQAQALLEKAN